MTTIGFGFLPPEVNSGLMYAGAGAGPMLTAASVWDGLAAELHTTAAGYSSVVAGLTSEGWGGPASTAMAAAAAPYASWMSATAAQVEQTAAQLRAAVGAYETAHAATVPPAVVAANRAQLLMLVATNILGQNTPAIAANEAQYAEMWAQDAAAMDGYSAAASADSVLAKFSRPPHITNPAAAAAQALAVGKAQGNAVGTQVQQAVAPTLSAVAPSTDSAGTGLAGDVGSALGVTSAKDALGWATMVPQNGSYLLSLGNSLNSLLKAGGSGAAAAAGASAAAPTLSAPAVAGLSGVSDLGGVGSALTAGLGQSGTIGGLSVPQAWAAASPVTSPIAPTLASTGFGVSPGIGANPGGLMNGMPMLAHAARAAAGSGGHAAAMPRFDLRPTVVPMTPAAG